MSDLSQFKDKIGPFCDEWNAKIRNCNPLSREEKDTVYDAVNTLYTASGRGLPQQVIFASDPIAASMAYSIASAVWYLRDNPQEAFDVFHKTFDDSEIEEAVRKTCRSVATSIKSHAESSKIDEDALATQIFDIVSAATARPDARGVFRAAYSAGLVSIARSVIAEATRAAQTQIAAQVMQAVWQSNRQINRLADDYADKLDTDEFDALIASISESARQAVKLDIKLEGDAFDKAVEIADDIRLTVNPELPFESADRLLRLPSVRLVDSVLSSRFSIRPLETIERMHDLLTSTELSPPDQLTSFTAVDVDQRIRADIVTNIQDFAIDQWIGDQHRSISIDHLASSGDVRDLEIRDEVAKIDRGSAAVSNGVENTTDSTGAEVVYSVYECDLSLFLIRCCGARRWLPSVRGRDRSALPFLVFAKDVMKAISDETADVISAYETIDSLSWYCAHSRFCIVVDRPSLAGFDERGLLHSTNGPAVLWRNGCGLYALHGTQVPAMWIDNPEAVDPVALLNHVNLEVRRAGIEFIGWNRMLRKLPHKIVDEDADPQIGTLVEVEVPDQTWVAAGQPARQQMRRFLRVRCGTGRDFALSVPPEMQTALEANAWTFGETSETFQKGVRT